MKILYIYRRNDPYLKGFLKGFIEHELFVLDLMNFRFLRIENSIDFDEYTFKCNIENKYYRYFLRYVFALMFLIKINYKFDVIHVLSLKRENFYLIPFLRKRAIKLILSIYGKSTYKNMYKRILFKHIYNYFDTITFQNQSVLDEFSKTYPFILNNLKQLVLPLSIFNEIDDLLNKNYAYTNFELGIKNKIIISCSSTISSYDQHFQVIDSLKHIKNQKNIQLQFLLTYGGSAKDKERIIEKINNELTDFDFIIFDNYLNDNELALIRLSTDIFINMRKIDQMAGAMIESIYCGSIAICSSKLNYKMLEDIGIKFLKVSNFDELSLKLDYCIENILLLKEEYSLRNKNLLKETFDFDVIIKNFLGLYNN